MDQQQEDVIDTAVRVLRKSNSVLFITGAGISADSGVPTYRGIGGLYDIELTEEGLPIEEILSGVMFRANPELTWKYLGQIADSARGATYNRAHAVIAQMEQRFGRVWTLTQNVDGFHRAAGSQNVIEIHGNMRSLSCTGCSYRTLVEDAADLEIPPRCPNCSDILRPDVVLFGEALPEEALSRLYREAETGFGAVFSIGTSSVFPYIQEPVLQARRMGVPTFEINPGETILSDEVDYHLSMNAADAMDEIWERFCDGE
jgi:NAD-dependent deacetylase